MTNIFSPNNPGIGGIDELTSSEESFIQNLAGLSYAQGDVLYYNGTVLTRLAAGTSGKFLKTQGAAANPIWDTAGGVSGTINEIAYFDSGTSIASLAVATYPSLTELTYVKGVTSAIQTQLNAKQGTLTNSAGLLAALSDETGTGLAVFNTSPTLVTPALGTPSALVGTNITGTAASLTAGNVTTNANLTGHVTSTGNAAILGSFTIAQLNTAVSDADVAILGANTFTGVQTLTSATPQLILGVNTTTLGSIKLFGNTSGDATIQPAAVAGTATVITLPAVTSTLATLAGTETLTNKTLTSPTLVTPALGTPASGVMTNVTGVPAAAILAGSFGAGAYVISTSLQAATLEVGHATDTTLSRSAAGILAVEGVVIPSISSTDALSNKTLTAPKLVSGGFIADANGNELLIGVTTASAVNEVTLTNAATAGAPKLATTGGDTNINLDLDSKGTGIIRPQHAVVNKVVALTDGANIATDASLGNIFTVTLAGNRTMGNPTNPTDGQTIIYKIKQDATGSRTITWGANFRGSTDVALPTLTTTAAYVDYVMFYYNSAVTKWDCLSVNRGFAS